MIGRSRTVAGNLNKGIEGLFRKYKVESKFGTAKVVAPNTVQVGDETFTAESIVVATGVRPRPLAGRRVRRQDDHLLQGGDEPAEAAQVDADRRRRADRPGVRLLLQRHRHQGRRWSSCSTASSPGEDEEVSAGLLKSLTKRGLEIHTKSKTGKVEKTAEGVKVEVETPEGKKTFEAEVMLVSIGVLGNVEGLFDEKLGVEIVKNHIKADLDQWLRDHVPRASTPWAT